MRDRYNQPQVGVDHPLACFAIALFDFLCQLELLLQRQKRKPPDIAHLPVKPGFAFIHAGSYDGADPPLRRESGILYGENDAEMHFAAAELLLSLG